MEVDENDGKSALRDELAKQRELVELLERAQKIAPAAGQEAALAAATAQRQALQARLVEAQPLEERLRITEINVGRRERAVERIKDEGRAVLDQLAELNGKLDKLQQ